jgi:hypothetical protein
VEDYAMVFEHVFSKHTHTHTVCLLVHTFMEDFLIESKSNVSLAQMPLSL